MVSRNLKLLLLNAGILGILLVVGLYHLAIFLIRPTEASPFLAGYLQRYTLLSV